jgi:hypothetical protein
MIAQQDVLAGKRSSLEGDMNVFRQSNYRWCMNGQFCGMKHVAIVLLHARDAFKDHDHCAPFIAHIDRLEGGIQD